MSRESGEMAKPVRTAMPLAVDTPSARSAANAGAALDYAWTELDPGLGAAAPGTPRQPLDDTSETVDDRGVLLA